MNQELIQTHVSQVQGANHWTMPAAFSFIENPQYNNIK